MTFHSLDFLVFFLTVFCVYWLLPRRTQNLFFLVVSYVFYGYVHPWFLYLLFASTLLDYLCVLGMKYRPEMKRIFLITSLVGNLTMLGFFKYFNFFIENVEAVFNLLGLPSFAFNLHIFLPAGISFYTFQTLSYTIDVYRGRLAPRTNFFDVAVFVTFFPQLVAGPIERARNLLHQFEKERVLTPHDMHEGLCLIVWGLFKKLVIADTVAIYCNKVFALDQPSFFMLWAGVFAFMIQLYADFSAYSDIARGSSQMLGFRLMKNFNHPYLCRSIEEFWQRWHISLSTWLRDYVMLSLHRSKRFGKFRSLNAMITFFLCGLWHGANWNFVIWGIYSGFFFIGYPYYDRLVRRICRKKILGDLVNWATMFFVINTHMLIFREHDLGHLIREVTLNPFADTRLQICAAVQMFALTALYSLPLWLHSAYAVLIRDGWLKDSEYLQPVRYYVETAAALAMFIGILVLQTTKQVDFIYFQF